MNAYINESRRTFHDRQLEYINATNNASTGASGTTVSSGVLTTPLVPPPANQKFKAAVEVDKIIKKFEKLTKDQKAELQDDLSSILAEELNGCGELFDKLELQDLVNRHMAGVLPDGTIRKIKKVGYICIDFLYRSFM